MNCTTLCSAFKAHLVPIQIKTFFFSYYQWHDMGSWCPCWPLPAAESTKRACEHQNWTTRMRKTPFVLSHGNSWMRARCLTREYMVLFMRSRLASGVSVMCFWLCSGGTISFYHPCARALTQRTCINVDQLLYFYLNNIPWWLWPLSIEQCTLSQSKCGSEIVLVAQSCLVLQIKFQKNLMEEGVQL